jgi:hypothetical protein
MVFQPPNKFALEFKEECAWDAHFEGFVTAADGAKAKAHTQTWRCSRVGANVVWRVKLVQDNWCVFARGGPPCSDSL